MGDLMVMTLTLIGAIGVCFAKPCSPEYWNHVKAGVAPYSAPKSARGGSRGSIPGAAPELDGDFAPAHA